MNQINEKGDPLKRWMEYHEKISEYVDLLERTINLQYELDDQIRPQKIEEFLNESIINHFKFEEERIFQPLLSRALTAKGIALILELQKDHGMMLREVETIKRSISETKDFLDKEIDTKIKTAIKILMDELLIHATKEDDHLMPILEKNRTIFDQKEAVQSSGQKARKSD